MASAVILYGWIGKEAQKLYEEILKTPFPDYKDKYEEFVKKEIVINNIKLSFDYVLIDSYGQKYGESNGKGFVCYINDLMLLSCVGYEEISNKMLNINDINVRGKMFGMEPNIHMLLINHDS